MSETMASGATALSEVEKAKLIDQFREDFRFSYEGEEPQRQREDEDLRFQVPELQWDSDAAASRAGRMEGNVVIMPRPMLSISKVDQPARLIMAQAYGARLGINIHPVSEDATDDTAEVLQDLIRRIERDSNANVARLWALNRAVLAGRGGYRINVRPDEDGFHYGDLEIGIERMLYWSSVYLDPSAQLPDYSDGDFAYITSWLLLDKATRLYKGARASEASSNGLAWANMKEQAPLWVREDTGKKSIQVAEKFWKEHKDVLLLILDDGRVVLDGQGSVPNGRKVVSERVRDQVVVMHAVSDGFDILTKPQRWLGKYIPLVPVLGRELQPFDEQRRIIGIIRNARDPQRFFNTSASTLMERMFMEPRTPWVIAEGQDEGREAEWAQANYRNIPVLHFKPTTLEGNAVQGPQRAQLDQTGMSIALMALQEAGILCQDATAFFDPSLGKTTKKEESGRHALALQGQGDAANGDWLENLAVAMRYEAIAVVDLIAPAEKDRTGVYDAPGRVATVLGGEPEKARKVMFNRPFVVDPQTGRPRAAGQNEKGAKNYDLRSGARYGVSIDIGTSFKTRLQQGDESLTRMVEADPTLLTVIGDLLFTFKDIPGAKQISERLLLLAQAQHPELFKKDDSPEQAAAKAKALEQQVTVLTQQLQEAVQYVKTDQAKHEAQIQIERFKAEAQVQIEQAKIAGQLELQGVKNAGAMAVEELRAQVKGLTVTTETRHEAAALTEEQEHETAQNALDRDHERRMQMVDKAHDVGMAAGSGTEVTRTHEGGQEQDQEREDETSQGENSEQSTGASSGPATGGEE